MGYKLSGEGPNGNKIDILDWKTRDPLHTKANVLYNFFL